MTTVMIYADTVPFDVVTALDISGLPWKAVASVEAADRLAPPEGWHGVVVLGEDFDKGLEFCRLMKRREESVAPMLLLVPEDRLSDIAEMHDVFDDFVTLPLRNGELEARLRHLVWTESSDEVGDIVEYSGLILNLATYQATVNGRPLDMTYMEYELLKHFVTNPGRVHTREELLRQVWGYEYYGGARTVDVHVRRLRAKLGDDHAQLISTVRSVGYIFGRSRL